MSNGSFDPQRVWTQVTDIIKVRVVQPTLWRSMEAGVGITIEDEMFIVGYTGANLHMASNLRMITVLNAIERALLEVTGLPLKLRTIDGLTLDDWEKTKQQDEVKRKITQTAFSKMRQQSQQEKAWEVLLEMSQRRFAALPNRQFPQYKAQYVLDMINAIVDTSEKIMAERPDMIDVHQRQLARVLEKVGGLADIPAASVALEFERIKMLRKMHEK